MAPALCSQFTSLTLAAASFLALVPASDVHGVSTKTADPDIVLVVLGKGTWRDAILSDKERWKEWLRTQNRNEGG